MNIDFIAKSTDCISGKREYEAIWREYGKRIVWTWEGFVNTSFDEDLIVATVHDGISFSHPLHLRHSYEYNTKIATLVHELGHILLAKHHSEDSLENHKFLYLRLYDVWVELFGKEFADEAVNWEREHLPPEVYRAAWDWALNLSKQEREREFNAMIKQKRP
jgi:hypothetical protein